jgi:predicted DsbA family dithiol-disulfide isomerase
MRKPTRSPNTRRALETAELLRLHAPHALAAFDEAAYRTHWVDGGDLGDPATIRSLVDAAGTDSNTIDRLLAEGVGSAAVDASMIQAREQGVTATPAWWIDRRLVIPGVQPRETVERWVTRLVERAPK